MIIRQGYWNYYLAFQVDSIGSINKCIKQKRFDRSILAIAEEKAIRINPYLDESPVTEIKDCVLQNIDGLCETRQSFSTLHGKRIETEAYLALTVPIIMTYWDDSQVLCPTYMYLYRNGMGVVKVRVPLIDVEAESFCAANTKKWYKSVELPQFLVEGYGLIRGDDTEFATLDISNLIYAIPKVSFGEHLVSRYYSLSFENLTLLETTKPTIKGLPKKNRMHLLSNLRFPHELSGSESLPDSDTIIDVEGRYVVPCKPGRILTFGNLEYLKGKVNPNESVSDLEFLENSIQYTIDWTICLAMWKKLNEITCLRTSELKAAIISQNIAKYHLVQHEMDTLLDNTPFQLKQVHELIVINLENQIGSYKYRIERMERIDDYCTQQSSNLKAVALNVFALFATWIFGLPAIHDTLELLRTIISDTPGDLFPLITIDLLSLIIWILLSIAIILILVLSIKTYLSRKIR